jgi:hypothetical protein
MTTGPYNDYRRALERLRDLPGRASADLEQASQQHLRASALADQATDDAEASASGSTAAIEAQLTAARAILAPLRKANLIPPRIRPSGGVSSATRDEVGDAHQRLAAAVNHLRLAVSAEQDHIQSERERLAREAAERQRKAQEAADREARAQAAARLAAMRRRRQIQFGIAGAILLLLLAIIAFITI